MVDYHSNYPEFALLSDLTAKQVVKHTTSIFSRHGIPKIVVSDNGKQFDSEEYRLLSRIYGFTHVTSSPHYPQSNSRVEKGVQIVKRLLKKATESKEDPYLAILNYRAAPLKCGGPPQNRKLRTRLLSTEHLVRGDNKAEDRKEKYEIRQRRHYDKSARPLPPLTE